MVDRQPDLDTPEIPVEDGPEIYDADGGFASDFLASVTDAIARNDANAL